MALPESVSEATVVVGAAHDFAGNVVDLNIEVTPVLGGNARRIVHAESGFLVYAFRAPYSGVQAPVTFTVPHVDQDGFVDGAGNAVSMWAYRVRVTARRSGQVISTDKVFQPLVGQNAIDLDLVPDGAIAAPLSAPTAVVTSVNGQTGAITVPQLIPDPAHPGFFTIGA